MVAATAIVNLARNYIGRRYVFGVFVPKDEADWKEPFDCAEFVSWLIYQTTGSLFGCDPKQPDPAKANAYTGYYFAQAEAAGALLSIEQAAGTAGALLLRKPTELATGHVVLCAGDGTTVEAMSTKSGVRAGTLEHRRWDTGILVPGLEYPASAPHPVSPPAVLLRMGCEGSLVLKLQQSLRAHGYQPGPLDGKFGIRTGAALRAFQLSDGQLADGEAGKVSLAALGIQA